MNRQFHVNTKFVCAWHFSQIAFRWLSYSKYLQFFKSIISILNPSLVIWFTIFNSGKDYFYIVYKYILFNNCYERSQINCAVCSHKILTTYQIVLFSISHQIFWLKTNIHKNDKHLFWCLHYKKNMVGNRLILS